MLKDKYHIVERLGAGGFGVVVRARQHYGSHDLGDVVLKFLTLGPDNLRRGRFLTEVRAARRVQSPHVVKIFDFDFDETGQPFIVMEYVQGQPLSEYCGEHSTLPAPLVLDLALQLTEGLAACHQAGVLHRDLKAANVMVVDERPERMHVKILDFGIARLPEAHSLTPSMAGTPRYMAPEQIEMRELDERADIFALGVLLYECFVGQPPVSASSPFEYLRLNLTEPPRPLWELRPDLPAELDALLRRMMAKKREERPGSVDEVEHALRLIATCEGWLPGDRDAARQALDRASTGALLAPRPAEAGAGHDPFGPARRRQMLMVGLVAATALALLTVGLWIWHRTGREPRRVAPISAAPTKSSATPTASEQPRAPRAVPASPPGRLRAQVPTEPGPRALAQTRDARRAAPSSAAVDHPRPTTSRRGRRARAARRRAKEPHAPRPAPSAGSPAPAPRQEREGYRKVPGGL